VETDGCLLGLTATGLQRAGEIVDAGRIEEGLHGIFGEGEAGHGRAEAGRYAERVVARAALRERKGMLKLDFDPYFAHVRAAFAAREKAVVEERGGSIVIAGFGAVQGQLIDESGGHGGEIGVTLQRGDTLLRRAFEDAERLIEALVDLGIFRVGTGSFVENVEGAIGIVLDFEERAAE